MKLSWKSPTLLGALIVGVTYILFAPTGAKASVIASDSAHRLKDSAIIERNGEWHVFSIYDCVPYLPGCTQYSQGFRHYRSADLITWVDEGIVVPPRGFGWESDQVWAPSIVEHNGVYTMFYTGVDIRNGVYVQGIGYATSTDLLTWERVEDNQVLDCGEIAWAYWNSNDPNDGAACRDPQVRWDEDAGAWTMVYATRLPWNGSAPPWINHPMVIALALSTDLVTWSDGGAMLETAWWAAESPFLIERPDGYALIWTDNGRNQGPLLQYAVASSLAGPFDHIGAISTSKWYLYAAEFFNDGDRSYGLAVEGFFLRISDLTWPNNVPTLSTMTTAPLQGTVWFDENADEIRQSSETALGNIPLYLYRDNGDQIWSVGDDVLYATVDSTLSGSYNFLSLRPGHYWLTTDISMLPARQRAGFVPVELVVGPLTGTFGQPTVVDLPWTTSETVNTPADVPTLIAPASAEAVASLRPVFSAIVDDPDSDLLHTQIQWSANQDFSGPETMSASTLGTCTGWASPCFAPGGATIQYQPPANLPRTMTWWRARTIDPTGSGTWSTWSEPRQLALPPPVEITNSSVTPTSPTSLRVSLTTNIPTIASIEASGSETFLEDHRNTTAVEHIFDLNGFQPGEVVAVYLSTWSASNEFVGESFPSVQLPTVTIEMSEVVVSPWARSALLEWTTNIPTTAVIDYGLTPELGLSMPITIAATIHRVTISNLLPQQTYYFRVRSMNILTAEVSGQSFQTTPEPIYEPPLEDPIPVLRRPQRRWAM